ncbi:hypothetical protein FHS94_000986 [Sphingomonas aerophila]|uniref:Uncharacterized protein n=1 Tax=Sphingomonas aerophila TaxID=1344948 RepID=A0A7W9BBV9_9SPHN|nr:hypothetical protein [Sphingomonas aerophila]
MLALVAQASAPQAPIAAGPFASIVKVLHAAKACRITELRISMYPSEQLGEARLFLQEQPEPSAQACLKAWLARHGSRLRLLPGGWRGAINPGSG